jgi:uncharacterized protein
VIVPLVAMLDGCASAGQGLEHRRAIVWRDLLAVAPLVITGMLGGLLFLSTLDTAALHVGLGVMLVAYALFLLSGRRPSRPQPMAMAMALPFGAAGGLVSSLIGAGGPFYVIYLQLRRHGAQQFRATIAAIFVIDGLLRVTGYLVLDMLDAWILLAAASSLPVMALALYVGGHCHDRLALDKVQRLISLLLVASGLSLLVA